MKRLFPLVMLLLAACAQEEFHFDPHTGSDGIVLSFLPNAPPEEFYTTATGEPLEIALKVENLGAFDVTGYLTIATEQDHVQITGWAPQENLEVIGAAQERASFSLPGKSMENPFGSDETYSIFTIAKIPAKQTETINTQILATACYPYQTELHAEVCVDTDPNNLRNIRKSCAVSGRSYYNQGAPVAITNIEPRMLPAGGEFVRPQFDITIQNVGEGTVLDTTDAKALSFACSQSAVDREIFNTIRLAEVSLSGYTLTKGQFECKPLPIKLHDGQATVTCTLKTGLIRSSLDSYTTDLGIVLKYGYISTAATQVRLYKSS